MPLGEPKAFRVFVADGATGFIVKTVGVVRTEAEAKALMIETTADVDGDCYCAYSPIFNLEH